MPPFRNLHRDRLILWHRTPHYLSQHLDRPNCGMVNHCSFFILYFSFVRPWHWWYKQCQGFARRRCCPHFDSFHGTTETSLDAFLLRRTNLQEHDIFTLSDLVSRWKSNLNYFLLQIPRWAAIRELPSRPLAPSNIFLKQQPLVVAPRDTLKRAFFSNSPTPDRLVYFSTSIRLKKPFSTFLNWNLIFDEWLTKWVSLSEFKRDWVSLQKFISWHRFYESSFLFSNRELMPLWICERFFFTLPFS
jgi:hypothetical protein